MNGHKGIAQSETLDHLCESHRDDSRQCVQQWFTIYTKETDLDKSCWLFHFVRPQLRMLNIRSLSLKVVKRNMD